MPIFRLKNPDGTSILMHVRMSRARRKRCPFCPPGMAKFATLECDFEIAPGKTCDARMCADCSRPVGEDRDYCPDHQGQR
jgi:hypothetical protein